jgi:heptaprenyl diphosphate synthase
LAYQIFDDCLDFTSDHDRSGKNPLADLGNGVPNLPLLYAARDPEIGKALNRSGGSPARLNRIADLVRKGGFVEAARLRGEEFEHKAARAADEIRSWALAGPVSLIDDYLRGSGLRPEGSEV